jgi:hypothetical protein
MKQASYDELLTGARKAYEGFINITQDETCLELNACFKSLELNASKISLLLSLLNHPSSKLTSLDLRFNQIGPEGAIALATALQSEHCKLTELNLSGNEIGDEGTIALATALQSEHCKITSLELDNNKIGDDGAIALANALHNPNCTLTSLDIKYNNIGDDGVIALANELHNLNCTLISLDINYNEVGSKIVTSINELIEQNQQIQRLRNNTYHPPVRDAGYGDGASKHSDEHLPQSTLDPKDFSEITSLIAARTKTLTDVFGSGVSIANSGGASKNNDEETQHLQLTPQYLEWIQYVYRWLWIDSRPCDRTAEIFKTCYELAPNAKIFTGNSYNTNSDDETKTSSSSIQSTFLGWVLHQELFELNSKQETHAKLADDEQSRIGSLFETMIKLDIDTFMNIISEDFRPFIPQALNIIYQLLENDIAFRKPSYWLKVFKHWIEHARGEDEKIELGEFLQVSSWALDYIKNNLEEEGMIKQSVSSYVAKFFKDYNGTHVCLGDDPIKSIEAYEVFFQIDVTKSSFAQYSRGIATQENKVDLATYLKPSPLDASLKRLGLFKNTENIEYLGSSRVKIEALDLAGLNYTGK